MQNLDFEISAEKKVLEVGVIHEHYFIIKDITFLTLDVEVQRWILECGKVRSNRNVLRNHDIYGLFKNYKTMILLILLKDSKIWVLCRW